MKIKYIPTIISNAWTTKTTEGGGNKGIHDQRKFKDGVRMLETAIATLSNPKLVHTVLTGSDIKTYNLFIQKFKRYLTADGVAFDYKGCEEIDSRKGQHVHVMWVVDTNSTDTLFDVSDSDSYVSKVMASIQSINPEFDVYVCDPKHHRTPFIPLTADTLQDAADYLSYIYKVRSKPLIGHRYLSSRPARRRCSHVYQDATPPFCLAVSAVKETIFKNIRFPTTASGRKCLKAPVYAGIAHLRGISDPFSSLKTYTKQPEKRCFNPILNKLLYMHTVRV